MQLAMDGKRLDVLLTNLVLFSTMVVQKISTAPINVNSNEIENTSPMTNVTVPQIDWLQRFGYFVRPDPRLGTLMSEDSIASSIRELQRFAGLRETGTMDKETLELLAKDRCGVPDFGPMDKMKRRRRRRFTLHGTYWKKKDLTWRLINKNNDGISQETVEKILANAFNQWASVTDLQFYKLSSGEADIMISFNRGYHQDAYPFDGRDGTLAHAFYPHDNKGLSGDVHFDDDEEFTHNSQKGKSLFWVAVHEIGHSLGLEHSNVKKAIMFPWYQTFDEGFKLNNDDVTGIQQLYGLPKVSTTIPPSTKKPLVTTPPATPAPVVCIDRIEAVFLGKDKKTYVINHDKLYILRKSVLGIEKGPVPVGKFFQGVSHVDAAYQRFDGRTILFSGTSVYIFDGDVKVDGPRPVTEVYRGFPSDIQKLDAVFIWPGNGRTYFFAGDKYWRYDRIRQKMDYGYPRRIVGGWGGIPENIEAAFTWSNGITYFFKGTTYYRLKKTLPVKVEYGYPRKVQENWMRCKSDLTSAARGAGSRISSSSTLIPFAVFLSSLLGMASLL